MIQPSLQLAQQHYQAGRLAEAKAIYLQILSRQPRHADALHLLGMVEYQNQSSEAALNLIREAIEIDPKRVDFHCNLGLVLASLRRHPEAIDAYQRALSIRPDYPIALNNLGNSLRQIGKFGEAVAVLRQAICVKPDYFEAHNNLGYALTRAGDLPAAIASFQSALKFRRTPEVHSNLGIALSDSRQYSPAIAAFHQALQLRPDYLPALRGLANALQDSGDLEQSIGVYQKILAISPNKPDEIELSFGTALKNTGQIEQARLVFERALQKNPSNIAAASNSLFILWYHPDYDATKILHAHCRWDRDFARPLRKSIATHPNDCDPNRRLKIGYVSPDFCQHALSCFTLPLLSHHDRSAFEIHGYFTGTRSDEITSRFAANVDVWRDCSKLSDEQLAGQIRADKIDLLVDLSLHTAGGRPLLFARKPAPVQIAYLAYTGTTGLETMDYRLTDPYLDPPGETDAFYSEKSFRLPQTTCCYDPLSDPLQINSPPALKNGFITFGCLNSFCKVNEGVLSLWSKVLKSVPTSRLLLRCPQGSRRSWVLNRLDVDPQRIEFIGLQPREMYLRTYNMIDIALDTFPYNGHTTSLDGLWMGVPMVTLVGRTVVGRAGLSQCINLGVSEFVARDESAFISISREWAGDLRRLSNLRSALRGLMEKSPLMDAARFAQNVELAYRQIWQEWSRA